LTLSIENHAVITAEWTYPNGERPLRILHTIRHQLASSEAGENEPR
jgi:hypothetical protein